MQYRTRRHHRVVNNELVQRHKATDFLYSQMLFWGEEGKKLLKVVYHCVSTQSGIEASKLLREFSDINNRAIDIASKLAPYQSPKLSSTEINTKKVTKFVIVAPKVIKNVSDWEKLVSQDQKALPKPSMIQKSQEMEDLEVTQDD